MTEAVKRRLIVKYTEKDCGILALALYEKVSFLLAGTRFVGAPKNHCSSYDHFGVKNGDCFWDIRGPITEKEFVDLIKAKCTRCFDVVSPDLVIRYYGGISNLEKNLAIKHYLRMHDVLPAAIIPEA